MSLVDTTWYVNFGNGTSTGYYAVPVRPQNAAVIAGAICRQFTAPAVNSERCFVCIVAGTTANVADATWVLTRGAKTTDGTATWMECSGQAALNGDLTNTATWAQVKAATPAVLGQIIKRSNNASYQICTTAGAMSASEPAFSDTAGVTTTDTTAVWTSLGPVANFTGGMTPHARLISATSTTWFASGNTVYVGDNHAETQGAAALNLQPASVLMAKVLCHNHSGSYPPTGSDLTTGATISTQFSNALNILPQGSWYFYGIAFLAGSGATGGQTIALGPTTITSVQNWYYFDNCSFTVGVTGSTGYFQIGAGQAASWLIVIFNNTTVKFSSTGQLIRIKVAQLTWRNTGQVLVAGSSIPAIFIQPDVSGFNTVLLEALDLSQLTGVIFDVLVGSSSGRFTVNDCKLNASATISAAVNVALGGQFTRSDSAATAYKSSRYAYEGTETTETSITRVGGAQDPTGQAQSRKIVTTANAQWLRPFIAEPYSIWNTVTGANVIATIYGTINSASLPNNDDIWIEVEYLGSSATPLGTIVNTTKASLLASNAAIASDSSSWNGGGSGAGWSPFKLVATLSSPQPGLVGYIDVRVRAAKLSTTYYIDPKIELT